MSASEQLPSLNHDEILVIIMEEAAEVIFEASKCLRFGLERVPVHLGGSLSNVERLSIELGDLLGMCDELPIDQAALETARNNKMLRARLAKKLYGGSKQ